MSWHFSQALVEAFSAGTSSDGGRFAPSKSRSIPVQFCSHGKTTGCFPRSRFGTISVHLTADRGEELLTWFLADFLARTSAPPEKEPESRANAPASGVRWRASSARYDRGSSSWKTHLCLWEEDLPWSSMTLPRWGMMRDGELWERMTPALPTEERDSGAERFPTPTAGNSHSGGTIQEWGGSGNKFRFPTPTNSMVTIADMEQARYAGNDPKRPSYQSAMFPTPTANRRDGLQSHGVNVIGGQLNPEWIEWLMGWPIGWTDLRPLAMDRFQQWRRSHGVSSEVSDV